MKGVAQLMVVLPIAILVVGCAQKQTLKENCADYPQAYDNATRPGDFVPFESEPTVVARVAPKYPELAMRAGLEGKVIIKIWVGIDGSAREVEIVKSDAEIFNSSAIEAGRLFKFTPATCNGRPIGVWVSIPLNYRLTGKK
jgi:TonB family protein